MSANKTTTGSEISVATFIRDVGIPSHIKGHQYLQDAISLIIENRRMINAVTKELYPVIAKKNNTTPESVERAIRYAIEATCRRKQTSQGNVLVLLMTQQHKPTNSEFIAAIADMLRIKRKVG